MLSGTIRTLIHLSSGTDIPTARLISAHNTVGYGYIESSDGDVFFDYEAITNRRFDELARNMNVEYVLDKAPYLRASSVSVVSGPKVTGRGEVDLLAIAQI